MVMCKYFLQGRCYFGENCKNEHSYDTSRRYYAPQAQQTPTQNRSFNEVKQVVSEELRQTEAGKQWLFSCFAPLKDISLPGLDDISPEELRYDAYQAQSQNNIEAYKLRVEQLRLDYMNKRNQFANMDMNLFQSIFFKDKVGSNTMSSASTSAFSQSTSLFGNNATQSQPFQGASVFGGNSVDSAVPQTTQASSFSFSLLGGNTQQPQPQQSQSIFGGGATFSQPSFGQAPPPPYTQSPVSSIFGQAPTSTAPVFGTQTTQSSAFTGQSVFGQNQSPGLFGQAPSAPTGNLFGQASTTPTSSNVFGQAVSTNTNVFGQPATTPTNTNVFGQAPTTPTNTNVFGQAPTTPTNTNVFGQAPTTPTNTSLFGQAPIMPNVFGQPSATPTTPTSTNVFGQAVTTPTASNVFGQTSTTPSVNPFGQSSASVFGQPSTQSVFGQAPAAPSSNVFGQTQSSNVFGQAATPAPSFAQTSPSSSTFAPDNSNKFYENTSNFAETNQNNQFSGSSNVFGQSSNVFGNSNAFTQPQSTTSVFGQSSSNVFSAAPSDNNANPFTSQQAIPDNNKSNPFTQANNATNNFYSLLDDLTEEMKKAFEATDFELGKIPTKPPPRELCF